MNSTSAGPVQPERLGEDVGDTTRADAGVVRVAVGVVRHREDHARAAGCSHRAPSRRSTARCPWRRAIDAPLVSSDRWAQASNPVIVYWVSRKPNGMIANQKREARRAAVGEAGVVEPLGEHVVEALVLVGDDQQDRDDRGSADDVPPHRDVVHDRHQVAAEDVEHRRRAPARPRKMRNTRVSE